MKIVKLILAFSLIVALCSCNFNQTSNDSSKEQIAKEDTVNWDVLGNGIIDMETKRLPVTIQKLDGVTDIKIDSFVVVSEIEPYSGYLITHWKMVKPDDKSYRYDATREINPRVIVEVNDIEFGKDDITWMTDWHTAYMHVRFNDEEY